MSVNPIPIHSRFWLGKRVFLTGHTGFKGSWLALWLLRLGAEVRGFSLPEDATASLCQRLDLESCMASDRGDVRDLHAVSRAIGAFQPEIVFHLAAQSLVRPSYVAPEATFATNVQGTVNVLEAVRCHARSVRAVVVVTSDKCYQQPRHGSAPAPFREDDRLGGRDPYSASKACAELVVSSYRDSFAGADAPRLATARAGNVIGGGDWAPDRIIPDLVRALDAGEPLRLRHPEAVRPWQHVLEPLSGYLQLAQAISDDPLFSDAWNFGPSPAGVCTVEQLVNTFLRAWGSGSWARVAGDHLHEAAHLQLDSTRAQQRLAWTPRWTLEQAVQAAADWYRGPRTGTPARNLIEAQLQSFCAGTPSATASRKAST